MTNTVKYKVAMVVILATVFGFASGVVGEIIARVYVLEKAFNMPLFGDIDFQSSSYGASNLVIRNPSKVIVEQNDKVEESRNSAKKSIVGIFKKKIKDTSESTEREVVFDIDNYYQYYGELGSGVILTSDGWILTNFASEEILDMSNGGKQLATSTKKSLFDDYVVITEDRRIYDIDDIILNSESSYSFWHIKANDLSVKNLVNKEDVQNGELVVAVNWDGWAQVLSVVSGEEKKVLVNSSDAEYNLISLNEKVLDNFFSSFLFNLNNEIVGLIDSEGEVIAMNHISSMLNELLSVREINFIDLGVNYVNLSDLIRLEDNGLPEKGLLLYKKDKEDAVIKGGPADLAGLLEGDIIVAVDNIVLDEKNSLDEILDNYLYGDEITLSYIRNEKKEEVKVVLKN